MSRVVSEELHVWAERAVRQPYMFHGMRHAGHVVFVAEISDIAVQGGARLVGIGVVDKQGLQLVR